MKRVRLKTHHWLCAVELHWNFTMFCCKTQLTKTQKFSSFWHSRIFFILCHLSIHVLLQSFIYCFDLKFSIYSSNKMVTYLMNLLTVVNEGGKKIKYSRIKFLSLVDLALRVTLTSLTTYTQWINSFTGALVWILILYLSKCAKLSNPKNDNILNLWNLVKQSWHHP